MSRELLFDVPPEKNQTKQGTCPEELVYVFQQHFTLTNFASFPQLMLISLVFPPKLQVTDM